MYSTSAIIPMPSHIKLHNACIEPCDTLAGACICGAWHRTEDWEGKIENVTQYIAEYNQIK